MTQPLIKITCSSFSQTRPRQSIMPKRVIKLMRPSHSARDSSRKKSLFQQGQMHFVHLPPVGVGITMWR